jgi:predicted Zn-dependent peptidase
LDYYKYYSLDNLIFTVVSDIPREEVRRAVLKHMPKIKRNPLPRIKPILHLKNHSELRKDLHQAHIALGFHAPTFSQKQKYAAEIFDCILGRGMSSRLWQEIREKRGLAYTVHSYLSQEKDYGFEAIYVGTSKDKLKEVEEIALKQARSLEKVDSKEVEEAKENLIGSHEVASEKSEDIAINLLLNEIATNAEEYYTYPERVSNVKLSEVRELAKIRGYAKVTLAPK